MSFPPHMPMIPPMPFFPPGAPMMIPPNMSTPPPLNGAVKTSEADKKNRVQTPTTVFVGSISERAPDTMIKRMLQNCGSVMNWKRVQGANGKLQAFGFCEYENPESTLRCIRLLNGWLIQDKKLVVKVDAKTKALLDEYKKKKRHELAKKAANDTTAFKFVYEEDEDEMNSTNAEGKKKSGEEGEIEDEEEHDYIDNETRREDLAVKQSLETIMREYSKEMNQRALEAKEQALREAAAVAAAGGPPPPVPPSQPSAPNQPSDPARRTDPATGLDDEEGKRSLITNEIQMFRDRFKDEETKMRNTEKERKDRYERERALQREKRAAEEAAAAAAAAKEERKSRSSSRDRSPSSRRRDRSSPSDDRYRRTHTSNSVRSRTSDRRGSPSRYDRRSPRSYRRSRTKSPPSKNHNDEDDDEAYERRRQEKRLREKEIHYRERLKAWEQRERRKQSEYEAEKRQELNRLQEEEKEAKRLLAFLEDYNDENDDPKYYKGAGFTRRLKDREREIELDNRDRRYEKDEIEELRQKLLLQNDIDDIEIEIKKRLEKEEELIRKSLADLIRASDESESESDHDDERKETSNQSTKNESMEQSPPSQTMEYQSPDIETKVSPKQTSALGGAPITGTKIISKRKLAVNEAFRDEDDENNNTYQKKSKLSALPDQQTVPTFQNSPQIKEEPINRSSTTKSAAAPVPAPVTPTNNANSAQIQEEKRQAVRKLIESIPTKKEDLFTFTLDWSLLDSNLMEKRIKPWVTKKIVEYIGEEEPVLTDFICQSVMTKKNPDAILSDIRVVLEDEAEVFVVKMWRLIVYEIEAKRIGLSK